jgi:hypothetical protein
MSETPAGAIDSSQRTRRSRYLVLAASLIAIAVAALVGAYIDWIWWPVYQGLLLAFAAVAILVVGAIIAIVGSGIVRPIGLIVVSVGVGLVAGQNLGPSREPLIHTTGGAMILRLESPVVAEASGPADCTNVGSETEFQVSGGPRLELKPAERVVDQVYVTVGDRWDAIDDAPRKDGVRLDIAVTDLKIPDSGAPVMVVMGATGSSSLESTFSSEGGSLRFARLEPQSIDGMGGGAPVDLVGTIEWSCGEVMIE